MVGCAPSDKDTETTEKPRQAAPPRSASASPEEVVTQLIDSYLGKRLGEYYSLVASIDREARSLESLQEEFA